MLIGGRIPASNRPNSPVPSHSTCRVFLALFERERQRQRQTERGGPFADFILSTIRRHAHLLRLLPRRPQNGLGRFQKHPPWTLKEGQSAREDILTVSGNSTRLLPGLRLPSEASTSLGPHLLGLDFPPCVPQNSHPPVSNCIPNHFHFLTKLRLVNLSFFQAKQISHPTTQQRATKLQRPVCIASHRITAYSSSRVCCAPGIL